jgi:ribosomal protein L35
MPKLRTNKRVKKTFRVTATGKVMYRGAGGAKLNAKKPRKMKRRYGAQKVYTGSQKNKIKKMLGV